MNRRDSTESGAGLDTDTAPGLSHRPVAPGSAMAGDWAVTHQMHLTFPGEVRRLLLQPRRVILERKVRSCMFYPFGGAI